MKGKGRNIVGVLRSTRWNDWVECDCCAVNDWSQRHEAPRHDRVSAIDQTTITALLSEEKGRQMRFSFLSSPSQAQLLLNAACVIHGCGCVRCQHTRHINLTMRVTRVVAKT